MERRRDRRWLLDKVSELSDRYVVGDLDFDERQLYAQLRRELQELRWREITNRELTEVK